MSSSKVSLKLLIDTKAHKVLFAEAGKDFVDFLFNLLSLPVGTVVRLLTKTSMIGSLGNLYESVENLNETYMQSNQSKETLLKPQAPSSSAQVALLLTDEVSTVKKVYKCGNCHQYIADDPRAICPYCRYTMSTQVTWVKPKVANNASSSEGGGYVKGVVTYMIKDDLVVTPMSTISGITMLNKCNITNISALEEKVVTFGMGEGLKLLKAALQSKEVLTSIFLGEKVAEVAKPRSQSGRNKRFATAQSQPGRNKRFATAQ